MTDRTLAAAALVAASLFAGGTGIARDKSAATSMLFTNIGDFPLGASVSRTDYESIDPAARRLYIAKMGGGQLIVFDIARNAVVSQLDGFSKTTGVLVVPEIHKVYASVPGGGLLSSLSQGLGMAGLSSGRGEIVILDTRTLKVIARLPGGVFPDGIAYDPKDRRVFVSDELGGAVTIVDTETDRPVGRIDAGGEVGNVRYDAISGDVYVPVQSHDEFVAIDPKRAVVISRNMLPGCEHPHGFAINPNSAIGYAACDGNDRLVSVDLVTGKMLGSQPVAHDPDVLAIDSGLNRLYVATESGDVSTYDIAKPDAPAPLGDVFVGKDAHAVAVDPVSHRLYFALADFHGRAVLKVLAPRSR